MKTSDVIDTYTPMHSHTHTHTYMATDPSQVSITDNEGNISSTGGRANSDKNNDFFF